MKSKWYAIQAKRLLETRVDPMYFNSVIKPIRKHGQTIVYDDSGKVYHVFKATAVDRLFIFKELFALLITSAFYGTNIPSLVVRRFKPYGRHLYLENRIPGLIGEETIYYKI